MGGRGSVNLATGEGLNGQMSSMSSLQAPGRPGLTASLKASGLRARRSAVCSSVSRPLLALVGERSRGRGGVVQEAEEQGGPEGRNGPDRQQPPPRPQRAHLQGP